MSKHIAFLGAAALLGAALPAAAADYYDGGDRPLAFHSQDDVSVDGGRVRLERRQEVDLRDFGPAPRYRGAPGPVAFDERGPDRRFDRPAYGYGYGAPVYRRPVPAAPPAYGYGGEADEGYGYRPAPLYRPAAVAPVGPAFGEGYGGPDVGCTIEQAQSTTPTGWRKIVTHRTCYRR